MNSDVLSALKLSLQVASWATAIVAVVGGALGYWLARGRSPVRSGVEAVVTLPLVLPPVVTGYVLLMLLGQDGAIGGLLVQLTGRSLAFTRQGAAIAAAVVALPLMVKTTKTAFDSVDPAYLKAASTLGQSPQQVLFRVWLPLAWHGILAGVVLSFARALGEFGATVMLAGNIPGVTQTMPMAIYEAVQVGDEGEAAMLVAILGGLSAAVLFFSKYLERQQDAP